MHILPYRNYNWSSEDKKAIIVSFIECIESLDIKVLNTLIDKTKISLPDYKILDSALRYTIQRIENDSNDKWNYIVFTDKGRLLPMRNTARSMRSYNPIQSKFTSSTINKPIKHMIEDILEKDSNESYFIQLADFISFFVYQYYQCVVGKQPLPNRASTIIDVDFVKSVLYILKEYGALNLKANKSNEYGIVIYPK